MQAGSAYVIVYSIADRGSFESASELRIQLRRTHQADHVPIILVGNKADLARCREVSVEGEPSNAPPAPSARSSLARPHCCSSSALHGGEGAALPRPAPILPRWPARES